MANMVECVLIVTGPETEVDWAEKVLTPDELGEIALAEFGPEPSSPISDAGAEGQPAWWAEDAILESVRQDERSGNRLVVCFRVKWTSPIRWLNDFVNRSELCEARVELIFGEESGAYAGRRIWDANDIEDEFDVDINEDFSTAFAFIQNMGWDFGWSDPDAPDTDTGPELWRLPSLTSGLVTNHWNGPLRVRPGMLSFTEECSLVERPACVAFLRELATLDEGQQLLSELTGWSSAEVDEAAALRPDTILDALLPNLERAATALMHHDVTQLVLGPDRARTASEARDLPTS